MKLFTIACKKWKECSLDANGRSFIANRALLLEPVLEEEKAEEEDIVLSNVALASRLPGAGEGGVATKLRDLVVLEKFIVGILIPNKALLLLLSLLLFASECSSTSLIECCIK